MKSKRKKRRLCTRIQTTKLKQATNANAIAAHERNNTIMSYLEFVHFSRNLFDFLFALLVFGIEFRLVVAFSGCWKLKITTKTTKIAGAYTQTPNEHNTVIKSHTLVNI